MSDDTKTLEEKVSEIYFDMQIAREESMYIMFNQLARSIELLLLFKPKAHKELMEKKSKIEADMDEAKSRLLDNVLKASDSISKKLIEDKGNSAIDNAFMNDYEEALVKILVKHNIMGFNEQQQPRIVIEGAV